MYIRSYDSATLPPNKIDNYRDGRERFSTDLRRNKRLASAVELADIHAKLLEDVDQDRKEARKRRKRSKSLAVETREPSEFQNSQLETLPEEGIVLDRQSA